MSSLKLFVLLASCLLFKLARAFTEEFSECRIGSKNSFLTAERTWRTDEKERVTAAHKLGLFVDPDQDLWQFRPIPNTKNQFRLRNMKYKDEELFASENFSGMNPLNLKKRRNIYTKKVNEAAQSIDEFVWIFKPVESEPNKFYILNKKYREPLFVGTWVSYFNLITSNSYLNLFIKY